MGIVLGSFGTFQGNIWSVAPFIPVGPGENRWKKHKKSDLSKNASWLLFVFSHNLSFLGIKEVGSLTWSVTNTLSWIWSGRLGLGEVWTFGTRLSMPDYPSYICSISFVFLNSLLFCVISTVQWGGATSICDGIISSEGALYVILPYDYQPTFWTHTGT